MSPEKLRERRLARIEKQRLALENAAIADAMSSMFRTPTAKEWLRHQALGAALATSIVGLFLYFTF